jgi:large subunit ribosomal protein L35
MRPSMQKTNNSARKRFKISASGKVMFRGAGKRHLLGSKNSKTRRRLRKVRNASPSDTYRVKGALPFARRRYRDRIGNPAPAAEAKP